MRGYGQYCPVARAAEVLGERWTFLILRELLLGAHRFSDIQRGLPGISRSLLAQRLRHLELDQLVERRHGASGREAYWLTPRGADLQPAIQAIGDWAVRSFGHDPTKAEADPGILLLWIERTVQRDAFPAGRLVARFDFPGARPSRVWLVVEEGSPTACLEDPGYPPDLVVTSDARILHRVFAGRLALSAALREGLIQLEGSAEQRRAFAKWMSYSPFAPAARAAVAS